MAAVMTNDDLDILDPPTTRVTYRGETLHLTPLTVGAVPPIVRLARPVFDELLTLDTLPDGDSGAFVAFAIDLIERHGEALFEAVALAVGRERAWIEGGELDGFVALVQALVAVNRDFFVHRLAPLLRRATSEAAPAASGTGRTPSSSSSNADTP